ncbi:hypothetical protein MN0502_22440 [Arthrobacter sp. MN05-02]|nr:hypothetical protein MN0502_22440 [Arthrobacter sp. MN05-02]
MPLRLSSRVRAASAGAEMGVVAAWSTYTGMLQFYGRRAAPPIPVVRVTHRNTSGARSRRW